MHDQTTINLHRYYTLWSKNAKPFLNNLISNNLSWYFINRIPNKFDISAYERVHHTGLIFILRYMCDLNTDDHNWKMSLRYTLVARRSGNVVRRIQEVTLRRARLVLGWVTVFRRVHHLDMLSAN